MLEKTNYLSYKDYLKLDNLKGVINFESQTELSGFYVIYRGSVLNEKVSWRGISHLMEHLLCKNFKHLYDDFDSDGIYWNAYTSLNEIVFYITGLDKYVNKWKFKFLDYLGQFKITEEILEAEKKIVLEEYDKHFGKQYNSHVLNIDRKLFNLYNSIGYRKDLENITLDDCKEFFKLQFEKPSMIINVSKNKKLYIDESNFATNANMLQKFEYSTNRVKYEILNEYKKSTSILILSPIINSDFVYVDFIAAMLGSGLQSPFYQEIREKHGLTYGIYSYIDKLSDSSIIVRFGCQTDNSNVDKVRNIFKEVFENPSKYLTQERFDVILKSTKIQLEKNSINRYVNIDDYLNPNYMQFENYIDEINLEKVLDVYNKYFSNFDNLYFSNDKLEFDV